MLDRSVYGAQSFLYCPDSRARAMTFDGAPVDVDALPLRVAALVAKRIAETKTRRANCLLTGRQRPKRLTRRIWKKSPPNAGMH